MKTRTGDLAAERVSVSRFGRNAHAFRSRKPRPSRLWLWFVAAFLLQSGAWVAWFTIASKHKVAEVPLETAVGAKR